MSSWKILMSCLPKFLYLRQLVMIQLWRIKTYISENEPLKLVFISSLINVLINYNNVDRHVQRFCTTLILHFKYSRFYSTYLWYEIKSILVHLYVKQSVRALKSISWAQVYIWYIELGKLNYVGFNYNFQWQ